MEYIRFYVTVTKHKLFVFWFGVRFGLTLIGRCIRHDLSKYRAEESKHFVASFKSFRNAEFGTKQYTEAKDMARPAIEAHQKCNRHHPEFHPDGIDGMTLLDVVEMYLDWKAAHRYAKGGGSMKRSVEHAKGMSDQLGKIFVNEERGRS